MMRCGAVVDLRHAKVILYCVISLFPFIGGRRRSVALLAALKRAFLSGLLSGF